MYTQLDEIQPMMLATIGESLVRNSMQCSLALSGRSFFFTGPNDTTGELYTGDGTTVDMDNCGFQSLALGVHYTWLAVLPGANDSRILQSSNLYQHYPALYAKLKEDPYRYGKIQQVVLGSNGNYFVKGEKYKLDIEDEVWDRINNRGNQDPGDIKVCALGAAGSYIIQLRNGRRLWDLKGQYGDTLTRALKTGSKIKAAVLDPTGRNYFVMWTDGAWRRHGKNATDDCQTYWADQHKDWARGRT